MWIDSLHTRVLGVEIVEDFELITKLVNFLKSKKVKVFETQGYSKKWKEIDYEYIIKFHTGSYYDNNDEWYSKYWRVTNEKYFWFKLNCDYSIWYRIWGKAPDYSFLFFQEWNKKPLLLVELKRLLLDFLIQEKVTFWKIKTHIIYGEF